MKKFLSILSLLVLLLSSCVTAQRTPNYIIVDSAGNGDFKSIQNAINSITDTIKTTTIFIKKGTYSEKLFIEKPNIILTGAGRDKTIITASISRDEWRCSHADDWGVATINVRANDITLKELTIINSFGFDYTEKNVNCPSDSVNKEKTLRKDGHQMALRVMNATRLKALACNFRSFGGDTVSPWNIIDGMWYFRDCVMEGGVDFFCPRGWSWAENCVFISHNGPASIWHDGSGNEDSKSVLKHCSFRGYKGFYLGRYHRDAQFYLVDCSFSENMKDTAIYRVPTSNIIQWGHRVYYYNCHREGGNDFNWYRNNLPAGLKESDITLNWLFHNKWKPD
jgi:pectinesterase